MNNIIVDCAFLPGAVWLKEYEKMPDPVIFAGQVNVYRICITGHQAGIAGYYALLSPDEIYRAGSYYHRRDTDRFVISRAILRSLLAAGTNIAAKDIRFGKLAHKKPYQVDEQAIVPKFNVSHAGDMIVIAIAGQDVGADVEHIDPDFGFDEVLDYAFTHNEQQFIKSAAIPRSAFYEIWSRKESLLKATGKGIGNNLAMTECLNGFNSVPAGAIGSESNWLIRSFHAGEGYIGNISFASPAPISFFEVAPAWFAK